MAWLRKKPAGNTTMHDIKIVYDAAWAVACVIGYIAFWMSVLK